MCITDKEEAAIRLASRNANANIKILERVGGSARVEQLDWTSPREDICSAAWDVILGSDLVYSIAQIEPLRTVLQAVFTQSRPCPELILAHKSRHDVVDASLLQMLSEEKFKLTKIPMKDHHPAFRSPTIHIYRLEKLSE